jgi:hypothetical protein
MVNFSKLLEICTWQGSQRVRKSKEKSTKVGDYLPIQNFPKIQLSCSSLVISPVISPR